MKPAQLVSSPFLLSRTKGCWLPWVDPAGPRSGRSTATWSRMRRSCRECLGSHSSAAITLQRPRASAGGSRVRGPGCRGVRGAGMQGATPLPYVNPAANRSTARSTFGRTVPPRRDFRAHSPAAARLSGAQSHRGATFGRRVNRATHSAAVERVISTAQRAPPNEHEHEHEHADVAAPVCAHARELSREAAPAPR